VKKSTVIQAVILASTTGVAARMGHQLATHDVGVMATLSAVMAVMSAGLFVATRLAYVGRTTLYDCPAKGCAVSIRVTDVPETERARYRAYAVDHSKHSGSA